MNKNNSINIGGIEWKNPVTTAAGTFSYKESSPYFYLNSLGAITTKGVSLKPWQGNKTPRIAETPSGMLNAIGLENPGVKAYIKGELKSLKEEGHIVITNVCGHSEEEYIEVVKILEETDTDMIELNVSCPNVKSGGLAFGTDIKILQSLIKKVKRNSTKPLIVKLSPNITDITTIAKAAENAGADALSMINTLVGMRIDLKTKKPILKNEIGGLSGPAVLPIALSMVYKTTKVVKIPIIGMGGIMTGKDAYEFLLAGATAVAIGTAALIDPKAPERIVKELEEVLKYGKL